jgi:hypothetical protein
MLWFFVPKVAGMALSAGLSYDVFSFEGNNWMAEERSERGVLDDELQQPKPACRCCLQFQRQL